MQDLGSIKAAAGEHDQEGAMTATKKTTAKGFEPSRAEPSGFLVHLLNHSDTVSSCRLVATDAGIERAVGPS